MWLAVMAICGAVVALVCGLSWLGYALFSSDSPLSLPSRDDVVRIGWDVLAFGVVLVMILWRRPPRN
jgi:hypothetical protein